MTIRKTWWVLIPAVLLVPGTIALSFTFPLNPGGTELSENRTKADLRIFSWNVVRWGIYDRDTVRAKNIRARMLQYALSSKADLLCFYEFFEPRGDGLKRFNSNIEVFRSNGYRYSVFISASTIHSGTKEQGMAIFSKYPIISSQHFLFKNSEHSEGWISADIFVNRKTLRVMMTHLESFKSAIIKLDSHPKMQSQAGFSETMQAIYEKRISQLGFVRNRIRESPFPLIVCANPGDIPLSYTYFNLKSNLKDAFVESGNGFGKTFDSAIPGLRLDYFFVSDLLKINQFQISDKVFSDHFALTMDINY